MVLNPGSSSDREHVIVGTLEVVVDNDVLIKRVVYAFGALGRGPEPSNREARILKMRAVQTLVIIGAEKRAPARPSRPAWRRSLLRFSSRLTAVRARKILGSVFKPSLLTLPAATLVVAVTAYVLSVAFLNLSAKAPRSSALQRSPFFTLSS